MVVSWVAGKAEPMVAVMVLKTAVEMAAVTACCWAGGWVAPKADQKDSEMVE